MISKHTQFLDAIREKKLIRIEYQSTPGKGTIQCTCAPLDYGPIPDTADPLDYYWIWDDARSAGPNPQRLRADQIVSLHPLKHSFAPEGIPYEPGSRVFQRKTTSEPKVSDLLDETTQRRQGEGPSTVEQV